MSPLVWSEQIATHVTVIDYEHKQLVALLNQVEALQGKQSTQDAKVEVVQALVEYANKHFLVEEELMLAHGYPGYEKHRIEHDDFRSKVTQLENDLVENNMDIMQFISNYLGRWIVNHIQKVDKHLATFLLQKSPQGHL